MRLLSDSFVTDLETGHLSNILQRVQTDNTLMLAIRKNYINIYYRGGNIMKIAENDQNYNVFFDVNYNKDENKEIPNLPSKLNSAKDVEKWIESLPFFKEIMDNYFAGKQKTEREFQQLIARENNLSPISNETEYFISDIEYSDSDTRARFDMLAVHWKATGGARKDGRACTPAVIEVKYGDKALDGNSGILSHLKDFEAFVAEDDKYRALMETMAGQFNQLKKLELIEFNKSKNWKGIDFNDDSKPQFIFVFANSNPRSTKLFNIINDNQVDEINKSDKFDLRFFVSSFAGYGMHSKNMLNLDDFRSYLKILNTGDKRDMKQFNSL